MPLITIAEYARLHGRSVVSVRQKCQRGGFETARKLGRDWFIDSDEPYPDNRIRSGKYVGWRKNGKSKN